MIQIVYTDISSTGGSRSPPSPWVSRSSSIGVVRIGPQLEGLITAVAVELQAFHHSNLIQYSKY